MTKPTLLFLEPRGPTFNLIREAHKRGYATVAVLVDLTIMERLPCFYSEGKELLDTALHIESWHEQNLDAALSSLSDRHAICGVYSGLDSTMMAANYLRRRLGLLNFANSTLFNIQHKHKLREILVKNGLSRLRTLSVKDYQNELPSGTFYLKPENGLGSIGVRKIVGPQCIETSIEEIQNEIHRQSTWCRSYVSGDRLFLEEEAQGELLSVEGICDKGTPYFWGLLSRILYSKDPRIEMGSVFPYEYRLKHAILNKATSILEALEFSHGPFHLEFIVNNHEIELIDFNARLVGADVLNSLAHTLGEAVYDSLIDGCQDKSLRSYFQHLDNSSRARSKCFACLQYFFSPSAGEYGEILVPDASDISMLIEYKRPGDKLDLEDSQLDVIGCYLTVKPSFADAVKASADLRSKILINAHLPIGY